LEPFAGELPKATKDPSFLQELSRGAQQPTISGTQVSSPPGLFDSLSGPVGPAAPAKGPAPTVPPSVTPGDSLLTAALGLDLGPEPPLSESISRIRRNPYKYLRAL